MKYMGSKRYMLRNGLGELLRKHAPNATRVVDPFCGSGSVVFYVAERFDKPILAGDLQVYAKILTGAVIERNKPLDAEKLRVDWIDAVYVKVKKSKLFNDAKKIDGKKVEDIEKVVKKARRLCQKRSSLGPVWNAYGGHYFSPSQALIIDYLIKYLPKKEPEKMVCLAALITTASRIAAAPGHTAQPFQPTATAGKFVYEAWNRDIYKTCESALREICEKHARVKGKAIVADANKIIKTLKKGDLVFIDPPYSGVHYSRFYHVLETIARGQCGPVSGIGRYPSIEERPQSEFSNISQAKKALENLLQSLAKTGATVIFTFPKGKCSNGLSGELVKDIAQKWFNIDSDSRQHSHEVIVGKFSTLGGNNKIRNNKMKASRVKSEELLLLLNPKK